MKVLVACEESQTVCKAFRELGHEAYSCDIIDCSGGHPEWHIKDDAIEVIYREHWDVIIAHPPCTYFSNATNVNLGRKDYPNIFNEDWKARFYKKRDDAFKFLLEIWNAPCDKICIENVIGWLSTHWQKPTQIIQPFYFGQPYRKATCLWLKGLPKLDKTNVVQPTCKWVKHNLKSKDDLKGYETKGVYNSKERSKTFEGIAKAMAEQWGGEI